MKSRSWYVSMLQSMCRVSCLWYIYTLLGGQGLLKLCSLRAPMLHSWPGLQGFTEPPGLHWHWPAVAVLLYGENGVMVSYVVWCLAYASFIMPMLTVTHCMLYVSHVGG